MTRTADFDATQQLCMDVNDAGFTAEIVRGQVVVSPLTTKTTADIVDELRGVLYSLRDEHCWVFYQRVAVHIPPHRDMRLPDLMVARENAEMHDDMHILGHAAQLVVEVCSKENVGVNYSKKPHEYACAGVPLLLIIDPIAQPHVLVLMSDPVVDLTPDDRRVPYESVITVRRGDKLVLPHPFDLTIETEALFSAAESPR